MRRQVVCPEHGAFFLEPGEPVICRNCLNPFPPGVAVHGNVKFGKDVKIGAPADINGNDSAIVIGDGCDIASFVSINCADSHLRCIGLSNEIERKPITIGERVFVGQGAIILGGTTIGHHSVLGAGVVIKGATIPPWSLVRPAVAECLAGYFDPDQVGDVDGEAALREMRAIADGINGYDPARPK